VCSVCAVVQFRSCGELLCVTNVHAIMSAGKCKLSNVCLWWHGVTQSVQTPSYKLEGHGFDSQWYHRKFSLTQSFKPQFGPGVNSACNRNEYQEYLLGVKAACA
jgi:hypothetical protein